MVITAAQVNELRQKTGAGMMDCKKALTEANGDFEKAIEILRKKGAAVASKRAEKSANEGLILTYISDDKQTGVIVEINCETDFVAKSQDFVDFANEVLKQVTLSDSKNADELMKQNPSLKEMHESVMGKVGEKVEISRFQKFSAPAGMIVDYIHPGSKLGVLVKFDNTNGGNSDELSQITKDVAMQVAAMKPLCVYREEVSKEIIEKEMEIYKELARKEGKPENILEKIALGRVNKFYQENCLAEQAFIKDNTKSVVDLIKEFNTANSKNIKISGFLRFHLGDEKK